MNEDIEYLKPLVQFPFVRWTGILPAGTLGGILRVVRFRSFPLLWFSPNGLRDSRHWLKYGLATYYILFWMRLYGLHVPLPRSVKVEDAQTVVRAVAAVLEAKGRCVLNATGVAHCGCALPRRRPESIWPV